MKKKSVLIMCGLLALTLTACSGEESGNTANTGDSQQEINVLEVADESTTQEDATADAEVESDEIETLPEAEEENSEMADTEADTETNAEVALPDREALVEMFTAFINWTGFQYMYEPVNVDTLTAAQAVPIAAHVTGFYNSELEQTEDGQAVIPQDLLDATMEDYFGKTFAVSEAGDLKTETSMVSVDENGNVLLQLGDWGTKGPRFEIKDISLADDGSGDVIAVAEYGYYELEQGEDALTGYTVTYRLTPKENTKYGFVITDMQAVQK